MADHNELGKKGEEIAAEYLTRQGFKILERNWRFEKDEIDIIATGEGFLAIVEVKTRSTDIFGQPEEAVTKKKEKYIVRATEEYIIQHNLMMEVRYDIISIVVRNGKPKINHIREAFYPTL
jgi:putative endonuclease